MSPSPIREIRLALTSVADPDSAAAMAAYMRDRAPILGVATPTRRAATKEIRRNLRGAPTGDVVEVIDECWAEPEREFQYVGTDLAIDATSRFGPERLSDVRRWLTTTSWWDTVDPLSTHVVGGLVRAHLDLESEMDRWAVDPDLWLRRAALLHQLRWKDATDADRLFGYVESNAEDPEFFIRKACGWALRTYARTDPDAVRAFVESHDELSGLTRREARKHLHAG